MTQTPQDNPHFRAAAAQANANVLLPLCRDEEPEMLLATAYRKRIRMAPKDIMNAGAMRFAELMLEKGLVPVDGLVTVWSYENLCDLLWNRLSEAEQYRWLLKVT